MCCDMLLHIILCSVLCAMMCCAGLGISGSSWMCCGMVPPAPMNHVKIFKGWPPRVAPSKLVQLWYKSFPPDQRGVVEMKNPTRLSN